MATKKLSRDIAIALVKTEEGFDFSYGQSDILSMSQLVYLRELAPRLRGFRKPENFPGSTGRAVYEFLARCKFPVWFIKCRKPENEVLTVEVTYKMFKENLNAYRKNAPELGIYWTKKMLTQFQIANLE